MIVFRILLIILMALPVIAFAGVLLAGVAQYVKNLNTRDRKRAEYVKRMIEGDADD